MATEQDVFNKLGKTVCRRCINREFGVDLNPEDCTYENPFPELCSNCGEIRNIVTGLRLRGKIKLLFK